MSEFRDIVKLDIQVNSNKSQKELYQLENNAARITKEMKGLKRGTEEYIAKAKELGKVTGEMDRLRSKMDITQMTQRQLNAEIKKLSIIKSNIQPGTEAFDRYNKRLNEAIARKKQLTNNTSLYQQAMQSLKTTAMQIGPALVAMLGVQTIIGQTGQIIRRNAELDDSLADVMKTTGMTKEEVKQLSAELKKIDTRTSRADLLELAYAAGKLGNQGQEDVLGFVRAADKIQVALGKDLGKDAITTIGKLVNIFKLKEQFGLEEGMLKIASAMNDLGMASEASEGYLAEFMKRMGGVAPLVKLTAPETLALGATLDSLGQTSEVSSTALSKLFIQFAKDSEVFAKFAKMDGADFRKLMDENFMEAFIAVLEGVKDNSNGINELTATLGDMGVEGGRVVGVLGTLANNTVKLREQINLGNKAFEDGTSVIDEFNIKNETLAAKIEKLNKAFASFFASSGVSGLISRGVDGIASALNFFTKSSDDAAGSLVKLRSEFNLQIDILNKGNLSVSERVRLIKEINTKYADYLPYLIDEKGVLIDIDALQKEVNKNMLGKIMLMRFEAEQKKILEEEADAVEKLYQSKKKLVEVENELEERRKNPLLAASPIGGKTYLDEADRLKKTQDNANNTIKQTPKLLDNLKQKYKEMFSEISLDFDEFMKSMIPSSAEDPATGGGGGGGGGTTVTGLTDEQKFEQELTAFLKREREQRFLDSLDADTREFATLADKYTAMIAQAEKFGIDILELEADWGISMEEILIKQAERKAEIEAQAKQKQMDSLISFQEQLYLMGLDNEAREEVDIMSKYDRLMELNDEFYSKNLLDEETHANNIIAIKRMMNEELGLLDNKRIRQKTDSTKKEMDIEMQGLQTARIILGGMSQMLADVAENDRALLIFKELAAFSEIAINSAIGMSAAVKSGNPIQIAVSVASVLGTIGSAMAMIKNVKQPPAPKTKPIEVRQRRKGGFFRKNQPGNPSTGATIPLRRARVRGEDDGMMYDADFRPDISGGMLTAPTLVLAGEENKEYFVNSTMLQDPLIANVVDAMEQRRLGKVKQADFGAILQNIAFRQFKSGGFTEPTTTTTTSTGGNRDNGDMMAMLRMQTEALNKLNKNLEKGIMAYIPDETIVDFESRKNILDEIRTIALGE